MEIQYGRIFYNVDDEEPDCGICDNQENSWACKHCGSEYGWHYYKREELDPATIDLIKKLERLGLK